MDPVTQGQAILKWGTENESWGYCEDITVGDEADKTPIKDGNDNTTGIIYSDIRQKVSANYTPLAAQTTPPFSKADIIGSTLTLKTAASETIEIVVDSAEKKYKKGAITTWAVTGYKYPNLATGA